METKTRKPRNHKPKGKKTQHRKPEPEPTADQITLAKGMYVDLATNGVIDDRHRKQDQVMREVSARHGVRAAEIARDAIGEVVTKEPDKG